MERAKTSACSSSWSLCSSSPSLLDSFKQISLSSSRSVLPYTGTGTMAVETIKSTVRLHVPNAVMMKGGRDGR